MTSEKLGNINMLVGVVDGQADRDLAKVNGGPDLGTKGCTCSFYGHLLEAYSLPSESVTSLAVDLLPLAIGALETMSTAGTLEGRVGALKSTLSYRCTCIGELELRAVVKNS